MDRKLMKQIMVRAKGVQQGKIDSAFIEVEKFGEYADLNDKEWHKVVQKHIEFTIADNYVTAAPLDSQFGRLYGNPKITNKGEDFLVMFKG